MGLMSLLVYAGSAQFVMCAMFVAGADLFSIVMTVFLINLRNFLMSLHATTIFTKSSLWQLSVSEHSLQMKVMVFS